MENYKLTMLLLCNSVCGFHSAYSDSLINDNEGKPNVIFVFADQLRAQALGYAGDSNVVSPHINQLAEEAVNFKYAVSCMPVSTPYRGCLMTGQYALTNGLFMNDVQLNPNAVTIGKLYRDNGYNTGYIGKWHINGNGRSNYIEEEHRQGFEYFKALECTHNYNKSAYYDNNDREKKYWDGYDAIAQTKDAIDYMKLYSKKDKPFLLVLSWGSPHGPYFNAPQKYKDIYKDRKILLRDNVNKADSEDAIKTLKGYYAHISALDDCIGMLQKAIEELGIEKNTIFVFTSDHGDMLASHGYKAKQKPWDESIMVPFLLKYPQKLGDKGVNTDVILNTPDILPTLLGLSDIEIPDVVEGTDLSPIILGEREDDTYAALIECITPFGEYCRINGGKEYRGIRTRQYTYVKDLNGPWLLYDNWADPYQLENLIDNAAYAEIQKKLDKELMNMLKQRNDEFLPGEVYVKKWGYPVDENGTVPYTN